VVAHGSPVECSHRLTHPLPRDGTDLITAAKFADCRILNAASYQIDYSKQALLNFHDGETRTRGVICSSPVEVVIE
jgi:hypothetical protein